MEYKYKTVGDVFRDFPQLCDANDNFGVLLAHYLLDRNLTRKELANQINASAAAVSHWISGRRVPDASTIYAIVDVLRLDNVETKFLLEALRADAAAKQLREYVDVASQLGDTALSNNVIRLLIIDLLKFKRALLIYHRDLKKKNLTRITDAARDAGITVQDVFNDTELKKFCAKYKIDPASVLKEMSEFDLV